MITKLVDIQAIKGADRIVSAGVHNGAVVIARVIVGINHTEGEVGIYFAPDLQLSEEFCRENDLIARYDEEGKKIGGGYFNDKRRVTAQRFRGVRSEGLWMPMKSMSYIDSFVQHPFKLGDLITDVDGHELCKRYISEAVARARASNSKSSKIEKAVLDFPKHRDTAQLIHEIANIPVGSRITFSEKLHGTSHRKGKPKVAIELAWYKKVINYLARFINKRPFATEEYQIVHGTRNVIISAGKIGFHGAEDFRYAATAGGDLYGDEIIYGEIVGYANGKSIMPVHATKDVKEIAKKYGESVVYHYGNSPNACTFYVYRITQKMNGVWTDLSFGAMAARATELGYKFVTPIHRIESYDGDAEALMAVVKNLAETEGTYAQSIYADHPAEGIVLHVETPNGMKYALKYKSFGFKVMEGIAPAPDEDMESLS